MLNRYILRYQADAKKAKERFRRREAARTSDVLYFAPPETKS